MHAVAVPWVGGAPCPNGSDGTKARRLRPWIDECLSLLLVGRSSERGYEATYNRDRGPLGASDRTILKQVRDQDFVLLTNKTRPTSSASSSRSSCIAA